MIAYHHIFSYDIGSFGKDFEMIRLYISLNILQMYYGSGILCLLNIFSYRIEKPLLSLFSIDIQVNLQLLPFRRIWTLN